MTFRGYPQVYYFAGAEYKGHRSGPGLDCFHRHRTKEAASRCCRKMATWERQQEHRTQHAWVPYEGYMASGAVLRCS